MGFRIITSITTYKNGRRVQSTERPFPKVFSSKEEAESFGNRWFNPPISVDGWKVEEVKNG